MKWLRTFFDGIGYIEVGAEDPFGLIDITDGLGGVI